MLTIRRALPDELSWVNQQYDKVGFQHSVFENEIIAIAEFKGEKAGIGRLVWLSDTELELGGMYVCDGYRGHGVARTIVGYLKQQVRHKTLYCLPFVHLERFYRSTGFRPVTETAAVSELVMAKWQWCNRTYQRETLLLVQEV